MSKKEKLTNIIEKIGDYPYAFLPLVSLVYFPWGCLVEVILFSMIMLANSLTKRPEKRKKYEKYDTPIGVTFFLSGPLGLGVQTGTCRQSCRQLNISCELGLFADF